MVNYRVPFFQFPPFLDRLTTLIYWTRGMTRRIMIKFPNDPSKTTKKTLYFYNCLNSSLLGG